MESVSGMRGQRVGAGAVTDDDPIGRYVREVSAFLHVDARRRGRILEEMESHLRDSVSAATGRGVSAEEATARALEDFGVPELVATEFNEDAVPVRTDRGARRWLPMVLPVAMLLLALGVIVVSIVAWWPGGMTSGERHAQRAYLRTGLIAAALSYAAYFAIRRADNDVAWRIAAWACSPFALVLLLT